MLKLTLKPNFILLSLYMLSFKKYNNTKKCYNYKDKFSL